MASYAMPPPPSFGSKDYISSSAPFQTDSIPIRQDYERFFLDHKKALVQAKKTMDTQNEEVFGEGGLRQRLAANHRVNPPVERRQMEIARDNSKLVERLTEISFKNHSATTNQIVERNKRVVSRLTAGGSLNDHIRAQERARIEEDNMGLASRLLTNKSEYAPKNFKAHQQQHEYLVRNKSRLRAIQMKTSTPGTFALGSRSARTSSRSRSPLRASTAGDPYRNQAAEGQASDEYAGALRSYTSQQVSLGYGLPGYLPPIPGSSDVELFGKEDPWLENHQSDLQRLKQLNTHAPKVRQSLGINPREALHHPLKKHYHHSQSQTREELENEKQLQKAFQVLDTELVVPRTRLDATTGAYETIWIDVAEALPSETHLAQRKSDLNLKASERELSQRAEAQYQAQYQAAQAYAYQQQAAAMYAAYVAHVQATGGQLPIPPVQPITQVPQQQQQQEAKESTTHASQDASVGPDGPNVLAVHPYPYPPPSPNHQIQIQQQQPRTMPDGSPFAAPIWPFGGTILPPHLLPPESSLPQGPAKKTFPRRSASTRRGLGGKLIYPIRKHPHQSPVKQGPQTQRLGGADDSSPRKSAAKAANASVNYNSGSRTQRWQSHAQHVDQVAKYSKTLSAHTQQMQQKSEPNSPSKSTNIPTISSALGSDDGNGESDEKDHSDQHSSDSFGSAPRGITQYSSTHTHIRGASGVPLPAFKDEFEDPRFMTKIHTSDKSGGHVKNASSTLSNTSVTSNGSHASREPSKAKPPIVPPPATAASTGSSVSKQPSHPVLKPLSRPVSPDEDESPSKEAKQPHISPDASVAAKVDAFEALKDRADTPSPPPASKESAPASGRNSRAGLIEPTPPTAGPASTSGASRSRRQSLKATLSASSSSSALAVPNSSSPGMLQIAPGTGKRSSLRDIPANIVSPAVAERASRRGTFDPKEQLRMKEEMERKTAAASASSGGSGGQPAQAKDEVAPAKEPAAASAPISSPPAADQPEFVPTSKYSDSHPFSIAHSSPSTTNLNATTDTIAAAAPVEPQQKAVSSSPSTSQVGLGAGGGSKLDPSASRSALLPESKSVSKIEVPPAVPVQPSPPTAPVAITVSKPAGAGDDLDLDIGDAGDLGGLSDSPVVAATAAPAPAVAAAAPKATPAPAAKAVTVTDAPADELDFALGDELDAL